MKLKHDELKEALDPELYNTSLKTNTHKQTSISLISPRS